MGPLDNEKATRKHSVPDHLGSCYLLDRSVGRSPYWLRWLPLGRYDRMMSRADTDKMFRFIQLHGGATADDPIPRLDISERHTSR